MESKIDNIIEAKLFEEEIKHIFLRHLTKGAPYVLSALFLKYYEKFPVLTGRDMIFTVCKYGNRDILYLILNNTKETDIDYEELFIKACNLGHYDIAVLLFNNYKINIHSCGDYALLSASENGHLDIVKLLLSYDDNTNIEKAFVSACYGGNINIINYLIVNFREKISKETIEKALWFINGRKNIGLIILLFLTFFSDKIDITSNNFKNCILCCKNIEFNKDIINFINYQYNKIQKQMYEKTSSILEKCDNDERDNDEHDYEFNEKEKVFVEKIICHAMDDIVYTVESKKRYRNSEEYDELVRENSAMKRH